MENSSQTKTVSALVVIIAVFVVGYLMLKDDMPEVVVQEETVNTAQEQSGEVVIQNTAMVGGSRSLPAGFPEEIPHEDENIIESAVSQYPGHSAKQLSLSYHSTKTVSANYTEFLNYMQKAGYKVTQGNSASPVRALFGTKSDADLSVVISGSTGQVLVQIAYLIK